MARTTTTGDDDEQQQQQPQQPQEDRVLASERQWSEERRGYEDFGGWTEDDERAARVAWAKIHEEREKERAAARAAAAAEAAEHAHTWPDGKAITFTLTGTRGRGPDAGKVSITWADGRVTGDPYAVRAVMIRARAAEGEEVVASGTDHATWHDHLSDPYSAYVLMQHVFTAPATVTSGGLPPLFDLGDLPEGAIP